MYNQAFAVAKLKNHSGDAVKDRIMIDSKYDVRRAGVINELFYRIQDRPHADILTKLADRRKRRTPRFRMDVQHTAFACRFHHFRPAELSRLNPRFLNNILQGNPPFRR
ncbi:hypothetical protein D3C75_974400 [compost metagenome]